MKTKRKLSFLMPALMLDPNEPAVGVNPPADPDKKDPPHGTGNAGVPQETVDRLLGERAARAAETERKKLWEVLGVTTQEDFDAYVKAKKAAEDANKTALEKAAEDATKEKARADKLETESKTQLEAMRKRIVDSEIKIAASKPVLDKDGKVVRPAFHADLLDDVPTLIDRTNIKDENGKTVGIAEALEALAKAKPRMLDDGGQAPAPKGPGTPPGGGKPPKPPTPPTEADKPKWTL